jgi:hypothetical protein
LFNLLAWFYFRFRVRQKYVTQAYLWFLAGVAFKLPQLAKAAAEPAPSPRAVFNALPAVGPRNLGKLILRTP